MRRLVGGVPCRAARLVPRCRRAAGGGGARAAGGVLPRGRGGRGEPPQARLGAAGAREAGRGGRGARAAHRSRARRRGRPLQPRLGDAKARRRRRGRRALPRRGGRGGGRRRGPSAHVRVAFRRRRLPWPAGSHRRGRGGVPRCDRRGEGRQARPRCALQPRKPAAPRRRVWRWCRSEVASRRGGGGVRGRGPSRADLRRRLLPASPPAGRAAHSDVPRRPARSSRCGHAGWRTALSAGSPPPCSRTLG